MSKVGGGDPTRVRGPRPPANAGAAAGADPIRTGAGGAKPAADDAVQARSAGSAGEVGRAVLQRLDEPAARFDKTGAPKAAASGAQQKGAVERATVVGAGPTGLAQASLLLQRAEKIGLKELTVVEMRGTYTRPIGLNFRQMNLDALAWLNPGAWDELAKKSGLDKAHPEKGFMESVHWEDSQNAYVSSGKPPGREASAEAFEKVLASKDKSVAEIAHDMMNAPTVSVLTMKDLEDAYWKGLEKLAADKGVKLNVRRDHSVAWQKDEATGDVQIALSKQERGPDGRRLKGGPTEPLPKQDLVVMAQGNSKEARETRKALGATGARDTSPAERYISGVLEVHREPGMGRSIYREETVAAPDGTREVCRFIRSVHATNGYEWALLQVPKHLVFSADIDEISAKDLQRLQGMVLARAAGKRDLTPEMLDAECIALHVAEQVEVFYRTQHKKTGEGDAPCPFGPNLFELKGQLHDTAVLGNNVVAVGDAVGNSHFNVSGGAATGVTMHTAALDRYLDAVATGQPKDKALAALDRDLQQATLTWQTFGITQFEGDPRELRDQYMPKALLEKIFPPEIVERYYPADGGIKKEENKAWFAWFQRDEQLKAAAHVAVLPPDLCLHLVRLARQQAEALAAQLPPAALP